MYTGFGLPPAGDTTPRNAADLFAGPTAYKTDEPGSSFPMVGSLSTYLDLRRTKPPLPFRGPW